MKKETTKPELKTNPEEPKPIAFHGSGTLAGVTAGIEASETIPASWKAAIKADLAQLLAGDMNFVTVDFHAHIQPDSIVHYHAKPEKKLL